MTTWGGGGGNFDVSGFENLGLEGLPNYEDLNIGDANIDWDALYNGIDNVDTSNFNVDLSGFNDQGLPGALDDLANTDWKALYASDLTPEQARIQNALSDSSVQNFGESAKQYLEDPTNVGNYDDKGFSSGWQKVGTDRVMIRDDGTGIGMKSDGSSYALTKNQVDQMIKDKKLNTADSGYVSATGGRGDIPSC